MKQNVKDPGSALTHFIGMVLAILAAAPLLIKAAFHADRLHVAALAVFIVSMILLYTASTVYHTFDISEQVNKLLRKIDHMMIFILIAGTYTPICLIVLGNLDGYRLLALVWGIAAAGILVNALWINCPKWFSSAIYIAMGWICVTAFRQIIRALTPGAFGWLLAGGIIYTVGGIIYALKFWFPRNLPSVCHGRKFLPLHGDVRICRRGVTARLHPLLSAGARRSSTDVIESVH